METFEKYLQPTEFFDFDKKKVREKALQITKGLETKKEKAIALFYWVRDNLKYNMWTYYMRKSNFKASVTLRRMNGFCVSKSLLYATFCRVVGIPSKIHIVDIINHKLNQKITDMMGTNAFHAHGYAEIYLNGKWIKAGPIFDKNTAIKGGFLPMVEFDGENDALFDNYDNKGNLFVEYIADRGAHADLPYKMIEEVINKFYGEVLFDGFKHFKEIKRKYDIQKKQDIFLD